MFDYIGDSVDRFILQDWCSYNHQEFSTWGDFNNKSANVMMNDPRHTVMLKEKWNKPFYCIDSYGNSIAAVHIFGSSPTGHYYFGFINSEDNMLIDTKPRLQVALKW